MGIAVAATMLVAPRNSAGQEPGAAEAERDNRIQFLCAAAVRQYRLLPAANADRPLEPHVAIRWRNPTRSGTGHALLVLWLHEGRPAAAATVFAQAQLSHDFV